MLPAPLDCDPQTLTNQARSKIAELNQNEDMLILTDIYGSTPSNIACNLLDEDNVRVISGVNLPMLIRVLNYPTLELDELAHKAVSGGKEGIMNCNTDYE
ncbi:MAG: PTS mannose transporter subunit IIA [Gammaproteobacteria bacterium]|nr:PTS mannose transporter subunit IIA [Gammaproteobacteria bacterium]